MISSLELARICGVSQGTVDRALHDRPGVSDATKRLIREAADRHGYQPHPAVRELLGAKSSTLGALVPSLNAVFFMDLMQTLKAACDVHGLRLFITPVSDKADFLDALSDMAARRIRGVIAVPPEEGIEVPASVAKSLPIATVLSSVLNSSIPLFAPDERVTGKTAVAYLAGLGHERIMHVTYARQALAIDERKTGYTLAMQERRLDPIICVFGDRIEFLRDLKVHQPTALFCHNDGLALSVIRTLEAAGISVPRDVSVMGVDNSPTLNQFYPDITTLTYPAAEIANKALLWLTEGIDGRPLTQMPVIERFTVRPVYSNPNRSQRP
jgi:DNA-binding LacI/PurR family transcriptional regulator